MRIGVYIIMSTSTSTVTGPTVYPKIGTNQPFIWESDHASAWGQMAPGETAASMAQRAFDAGVRIVRMWCHGGDRSSYTPDFEPRPGEFWHGGAAITRDGNGDITTTLYDSSTTPATSNIKALLDAYWAQGVQMTVDLSAHWMLQVGDKWDYNPYKQNNLNAANNVRAVGTAGWLTTPLDFFTDATAISAFKNRIDAWLYSYGDHEGVNMISLGNEPTLLSFGDNQDLFDWVDEMSTYLYGQFGSRRPAIGLSQYMNWSPNTMNDVFGYLYGPSRVVCVHSYNLNYTLAQKKQHIDDAISDYGAFTFDGESYNYGVRVEENWGFGPGPTVVPDTEVDINIQGDPILNTYAYENPPDDTVAPYPHERMFAFLAMVLHPLMVYSRWPDYIDGETGSLRNSYVRIMEIMRVARDFFHTCPFYPDMVRHEGNITPSVALDFKASLYKTDIVLTFVLVGSGNQTIDFGVTGSWIMVTYAWDGDGSDNYERVIDDATVTGSAVSIAFGDYTDGFVPGYLVKSDDYRKIVQTTTTTTTVCEVC